MTRPKTHMTVSLTIAPDERPALDAWLADPERQGRFYVREAWLDGEDLQILLFCPSELDLVEAKLRWA